LCFLNVHFSGVGEVGGRNRMSLSNMEGLKPGTKGSLGEEGDKEGGKGDLNKGDEGEEEEERLDKSW